MPTPLRFFQRSWARLARRCTWRLGLALVLSACSASTTPAEPTSQAATLPSLPSLNLPGTALPPSPLTDPMFQSDGGGEPRSPAYWVQWSSCGENNQAAVAAANGGREAGWIILDDILADPGVLLGELAVETCQEGVNLLQAGNLAGGFSADDAAYTLSAQLLAAQINLAAGAESCPAIDTAVMSSQLLLISLGFDGAGNFLGANAPADDRQLSLVLAERLEQYNIGALCR